MALRKMGKASFIQLMDDAGQIQIFIKRDNVGEKIYEALEYASSVFSPGTVWTDLILGPGSQDKFKNVIDRLTDSGTSPLIHMQRDILTEP